MCYTFTDSEKQELAKSKPPQPKFKPQADAVIHTPVSVDGIPIEQYSRYRQVLLQEKDTKNKTTQAERQNKTAVSKHNVAVRKAQATLSALNDTNPIDRVKSALLRSIRSTRGFKTTIGMVRWIADQPYHTHLVDLSPLNEIVGQNMGSVRVPLSYDEQTLGQMYKSIPNTTKPQGKIAKSKRTRAVAHIGKVRGRVSVIGGRESSNPNAELDKAILGIGQAMANYGYVDDTTKAHLVSFYLDNTFVVKNKTPVAQTNPKVYENTDKSNLYQMIVDKWYRATEMGSNLSRKAIRKEFANICPYGITTYWDNFAEMMDKTYLQSPTTPTDIELQDGQLMPYGARQLRGVTKYADVPAYSFLNKVASEIKSPNHRVTKVDCLAKPIGRQRITYWG